jgi:rubrerythrin
MDLEGYSNNDLILSALKSEVEAKEVYSKTAEGVKNFLLKDRLKFLASEEEKHRLFFETLYKKNNPEKELVVPESSPVPLPDLKAVSEGMPISEILQIAMDAESAAHDFYVNLSERFTGEEAVLKTIKYIASMELGHLRLLEIERTSVLEYEFFDDAWPMMHVGP